MKYYNFLFFMLVSLLVFCSISAVSSALFLDFLDDVGQEEDSVVELHGINFTLPAGYEQDTINNTTDSMGITTEQYIFGNQEGYMIDISILYNGNIENYKVIDDEHSPKTISGIDGMASSGSNFYNFIYRDGDVQVSVLARNESLVEKIVGGT